ncbi:hypothetical protein L208DRAFT_404439 [Tricholoma matsutake]|nr:hypothetical protein L208DRAFT_404439 [Tricholoma matsutake 945]
MNEPSPGIFFCTLLEPPHSPRWSASFYATAFLCDGILLSLALWQAWLHRPSQDGVELMHQLTRDSAIYFLMIFWIYVVSLALWVNNRPVIALMEVVIPFSFALPCIVVARLMIHMRSAHYEATANPDYHLSTVDFGDTVVTGRSEEQGEYY